MQFPTWLCRMGFTLSSVTCPCPCPCPCPSLHSCPLPGHPHGIPMVAQPGLCTDIYFAFPKDPMEKVRSGGDRLLLDRGHLDTRRKKFLLFLRGGGGDFHIPSWETREGPCCCGMAGTEGQGLALPSGPPGMKPSLIISNQVRNS